jgi:N-dimethylarginine dimethylaminohydrolase
MSSFKNSSQYYHTVLSKMMPKAEPPFHANSEQLRVWGREWGVKNDVGKIEVILVHRPGAEMSVITEDKYDPELEALIDEENQWYFRSDKAPNLIQMQKEHDALVASLEAEGIEVVYAEGSPTDPDAINVRDNGIVVSGGMIITRMGVVGRKHGTGRRGEEAYITKTIASIGMPILHTIHGNGLMEGGSFCLLDEKHAAIGLSYRGNKCAAVQVKSVLDVLGIELIEVPLTGFSLHLDGAIVMVDRDKALVNVERLPYWFLEYIKKLGIKPIYTDYRDGSLGINVLAVSPGRVLTYNDAPWTSEILYKNGVEVIPLEYKECRKKGGGIHCGTLPLVRGD